MGGQPAAVVLRRHGHGAGRHRGRAGGGSHEPPRHGGPGRPLPRPHHPRREADGTAGRRRDHHGAAGAGDPGAGPGPHGIHAERHDPGTDHPGPAGGPRGGDPRQRVGQGRGDVPLARDGRPQRRGRSRGGDAGRRRRRELAHLPVRRRAGRHLLVPLAPGLARAGRQGPAGRRGRAAAHRHRRGRRRAGPVTPLLRQAHRAGQDGGGAGRGGGGLERARASHQHRQRDHAGLGQRGPLRGGGRRWHRGEPAGAGRGPLRPRPRGRPSRPAGAGARGRGSGAGGVRRGCPRGRAEGVGHGGDACPAGVGRPAVLRCACAAGLRPGEGRPDLRVLDRTAARVLSTGGPACTGR